jgi:hypothetical protein
VALIDTARVRAELTKVRRTKKVAAKGKLVESLVGYVFGCVPGLSLDDANVINVYQSEEIDLIFWNDQEADGVRFLDCPLIVECKGWSAPVPGRELRYFASVLKDRGRRNGILVALNGITGDEANLTAAFYHSAAAQIEGVQVFVLTGTELSTLVDSADLVGLLKRKLLERTKLQIQALKSG